MPAAQAKIITESLQRFEALKPAYVERGKALQLKDDALQLKDQALIAKDTLLASYERSLVLEQRLRVSAAAQADAYRVKARRRGWWVAGLSTLLIGGAIISLQAQ